MRFNWKQIVKVGMLILTVGTCLFSSATTVFAEDFWDELDSGLRWDKEKCGDYRSDWPEGKSVSRDITYDFKCGWLKGTTGGVPTGSLTLPEENADKYDEGIVAVDEEGNVLSLIDLIIRLTNWALGFVGVIALVAFIYGGYLMVANFGNDEMTSKGRKVIIGSSIGIIVILLSFTAVNAILQAGGGSSGGGGSGTEAEGVSRDYLEATLTSLEDTLFDIIDNVGETGDLCPGTPVGRQVSVVGCTEGEFPADSDGDGVINLFDADDDNDGTPDKDDTDDDNDGVPDSSDFCPDTLLFSVARPYAYSPYQELIEAGTIERNDLLTGLEENGDIPFTLPYVRPTRSDYIGSDVDTRAVGCASYEGSKDSDGDGFPNGLLGGSEESDCQSGDEQINNIDCDDDGDGDLDKNDPDNDGDGVPEGVSRFDVSAGSTLPKTVTADDFSETLYVDDTLILDMRVLFPNIFGSSTAASVFPSLVTKAFAQDQDNVDPRDYVWVQGDNNPSNVPLTLTSNAYQWQIKLTKIGTYEFTLYDDSETLVENASGQSTVTVRVLSRTSTRVVADQNTQFPELISKFEREILITCSRLPQTTAVTRLCDPESGTLINALEQFSVNPTEQAMRTLLEQITILRTIVEETPKVQANIVAVPGREGAAPFVVAFSGSDSVDPQGVSIPGENFEWCVGYTSVEESLKCPTDKKRIGPNISEIFMEPGVYAVQLRVETADTDAADIKTAMDGYSTITIVVNPPSSNIHMEVRTSGEFVDVTDMRSYEVLLGEASTDPGVVFNVSQTTDYTGEGTANILSSTWDFGDGTIVSSEEGLLDEIEHVYKEPGKYSVVFEVQDNRYKISRKILELDVTDIVAELTILPESMKGDVATQFTFDASDSRVEGGQIDTYFWRVVDTTDPEDWVRVDSSESNRNLIGPVVNYSFPRVGEYEVSVTVSTAAGDKERTVSREVLILSRSPIARFNWRVADNRRPATVFFDASGSTDPDPNTDLDFTWTADGEVIELEGNEKVPMMGDYTFDSVGEHRVELVVTDDTGVTDKVINIVKVDSTLDVDFTADRFSSYPDEDIEFEAISSSAAGYFWDFGDGVRKYSEVETIEHSFNKAGNYTVTLTVDNLDGEENTISKRVRIGDKDSPIAAVRVLLNGLEVEPDERICGTREGVLVDRLSTLTFDGANSVNNDGTSRGLIYSWDFDDGQKASSRSTVHKFEELTVGSDCYEVTLTVSDRVTGNTDTSFPVYVRVENEKPIAVALDIIEPTNKVTPVTVPINLIGVKDPDGRIIDYTWYYYDAQVPNKKIDTHVTTDPKTTFTIGPRAKEGIESTYHFAVEIRDNDGGKTLSEDLLGQSQALKVTNGPSLAPDVEYTVDKSRVKVGEKINFTSTTQDPLGRYIPTSNFKWDFYGDGRYDREIVGPEVTFSFDRPGTYTPRLKVTSDGISETYEMEIVVEAVTENPEAAFLFIKSGNKITFINNSSVDPQLDVTDLRYAWDFDISVDTDGNGIKDDDIDSAQVNPSHIYDLATERDVEAKLKITDVMGQTDEVVRKVITTKKEELGALGATVQKKLQAVLDTDPVPDELDKKVYLKSTEGKVTFIMKKSTGKIKAYHLDLNIYKDSDGDGVADNDIDNSLHESLDNGAPFEYTYPEDSGKIRAQLTIEDFQGATDSTYVDIILNESGLSPFESSFDPDSIFLVSGMAPIALFTVQDAIIVPEKAVTFDASASSFPEENIKEYRWDFNGDAEVDEVTESPLVEHTFAAEGEYEVTLGIFSETDLYAEYSETLIVRDLYSDPAADFSYEIDDLTVRFSNLSTFDRNDPGNKLEYEWKFIPISEDEEDASSEASLVEEVALTEEGSDDTLIVTDSFTPFNNIVTQPIVLQAPQVRVTFEKDTELLDADDRPYEKDISVPKIITAPKGTLDLERKIIDAFFVASVKPIFVTQDVSLEVDLSVYTGLEDPQVVFYDLASKTWQSLESRVSDSVLTLNSSQLGIFALTDSRDSEVVRSTTEAEQSFKQKLKVSETSTSQDPVKIFNDYGSYKIVLTVTDVAGRKDSQIRVITLEPGVSGVFEPEGPAEEEEPVVVPVDEQPVVEEEIIPEEEVAEEEFIAEESVTINEPAATVQQLEKKGGISWFMIGLAVLLFFAFVVGVIFIINKIKDQLAHHEGLMQGQVPGMPPGAAPPAPTVPTPSVEVVEGEAVGSKPVSGKQEEKKETVPEVPVEKPQAAEKKAPVPAAESTSKQESSQPAPKKDVSSEAPSKKDAVPEQNPKPASGPTPKGGEGPIPDWLKKK